MKIHFGNIKEIIHVSNIKVLQASVTYETIVRKKKRKLKILKEPRPCVYFIS